jgi:GR25 family glycosyltransferase involved in LPS biosynthesis
MKTFCINLKKSVDRRRAVTAEFAKHAINATFIDAVGVDDPDFKSVKSTANKMERRCYCVNSNEPSGSKATKSAGLCRHRARRLRPVEIAISLSHLKVYQTILAQELSSALVCEDDIILHKDFTATVTRLLTKIDFTQQNQPIIVFLGAPDNPDLIKSDQIIKSSKNGIYSNYCYIVNRSAAEILVKNFFPITRPEDSYKRFLINQGHIKCYQIVPSLVAELSTGINTDKVYQRLSRK